jgi:RNA polymerase sigma factor for flagellar operon FliA
LAAENKTEQATPRRKQKAREKGQVARSRELSSALATTGAFAVVVWQAASFPARWHELLRSMLQHNLSPDLSVFRIRGAILDSLRNLDWSPRDLRRKARRLEDAASRLGSTLGRAATEQELANDLGMDLEDFHHMLGEIRGLEIGSLQVESSQDGQEQDLSEQIPADPESSPFAECLRGEMKRALADAIAELPEKEQQVLSLYYFEELTMKEVGEVLGVGESRVSQINSMALARLRARLRERNVPKLPGTVVSKAHSGEAAWKRS